MEKISPFHILVEVGRKEHLLIEEWGREWGERKFICWLVTPGIEFFAKSQGKKPAL